MDFLDALRLLLRRWYVVAVGLLLTAAAGGAAITVVPTAYQASGQYLLLLPAEATGKKTPSNPFLNLSNGLTITASLIAGTLSTKDSHRSMVDSGYKSNYAIGLSPDVGPLLTITVDDTDPDAAVRTRDELIRRLDKELADIQSELNVPETQVIHPHTTAVSSHAEVVPGSKIKALAVIGGAGMLLTLISTFAIDRLAMARRRKKNAASAPRRPEPEPTSEAEPRSTPQPAAPPAPNGKPTPERKPNPPPGRNPGKTRTTRPQNGKANGADRSADSKQARSRGQVKR